MRPQSAMRIVLVVVFLQVLLPQEAQGLGYNRVCEEGEQCVWLDANYQGCIYDGKPETDFRKVHYVSCRDRVLNDSVSSYQNLTDDWFAMTEHPNFKGAYYCVGPRARGNIQPGFNDKASASGSLSPDEFTPDVIRKYCKFVDTD